MGTYIGYSDLELRIGAEQLNALSGLDLPEKTLFIDDLIAGAEGVVNGFAAQRYHVPMETSPMIREWALSIAEYELYKRSPLAQIPEKIQESHRNSLTQLRDFSEGKLETGALLERKKRNLPPDSMQFKSDNSYFDSDSMKNY